MIAFLAIQILNLSINTICFSPFEKSITLGDFNYFNSFAEYVSEVILNAKDAFPEFQKESASSKCQSVKHNISFNLFHIHQYSGIVAFCGSPAIFSIPLKESYTYLYFTEINPPPPKI